jgi:uncharacterized protein (DUF488 family)
MNTLCTIGYEGATLPDFIATLKLLEVDVLLDVRELPASRRKGFSKNALKDALAGAGISYRHEKLLGSPRAIRHELRETRDYQRFFKEFDKHLAKQTSLLKVLAEELSGHIALLCFERNHLECHRTPVAEKLAEISGIELRHCSVQAHK